MSQLIKQRSFVNTANPRINEIAGDSGEIVLGICIYIVCIVPEFRLILRKKKGGDYSGAVQNTAALSETAEVFFIYLLFGLRHFQQGFAGRTAKVKR